MKGYLTTCDGAQFELPTLLKWEFSYTGSVPCDSFTLRCAYEPAMAETLRRAVRFTAREDGTVEFAGVVDECGVTCDEKGLQLEVSVRGMAALLLDNEAESVSYQWATMEEILKNHVTPYGIVCTGYDAVTAAARYRVANGSSQWKALNDFAALHGGIAPYFNKTGALEVKKNRRAARVSIDAKTPVTALAYCDKRYGVIAEALVVDSKAGVKQSVKNEAFCARGGTSRRVFYVPARSGTQAMRYTGEYQIAKSKEGAETLRVTIAGRFTAAPGDIAAVSGTKIGIVGNFRVIECVRHFGESGEACEVTMQREGETMWLSRKLSQHEMQDVASAQDGTVTVEGGELAVFSSGEKREVKTAAPGGYEWQPKKGEDVLVVRGGTFGEEAYAVGAVGQSADDLAPGEVRIRSATAGTEIVLRNNGRIDINGLLFINGMPYLGMGG